MKYLKSFNESKNVGILYHYTNLENLINIIRDNVLLGKKAGTVGVGISFTRDKKFHEREPEIESTDCRIVVNGDKLSHNYKFRPYNDYSERGTRPWNLTYVESEERCVTEKITNIRKYIISVDFNKNSFDDLYDSEDQSIEYILKLLNLYGIEYNYF